MPAVLRHKKIRNFFHRPSALSLPFYPSQNDKNNCKAHPNDLDSDSQSIIMTCSFCMPKFLLEIAVSKEEMSKSFLQLGNSWS